MSTLEDGVNLRDLGGHLCADGVLTKKQVVLRSCAPLYYTAEGIAHLENTLKVGTVIDLRSKREITKAPLFDGVKGALLAGGEKHVHIDLTGPATMKVIMRNTTCFDKLYLAGLYITGQTETMTTFGIKKLGFSEGGLKALYTTILEDATAEIKKTLVAIDRSIQSGDVPVMVHCTAGKDRTGIISAILLLLAGVARDTIIADYTLSEGNLVVHSYVIERQSKFLLDAMPNDILRLSPSYAAEHILECIGDVDHYLLVSCGVEMATVASLRAAMRAE
eukprot:TRINITY_DN2016_c0_g2_i1.p1 TRINITY_DN2016_c0_g2~~TRINITY_DN2016_c0_g2_i1.p1  ORF type:complete len:284 (+),score=54.47 TRINITY_DN2016_c0_g2_i1:23-853(+)